MSAYAQLNEHFDFNSTPLAPPGTRIIAHEKPDQRESWDPHGLDGYYLGPALDHYRCYQVHITKTKGTCIVDTVEFFPATLAMPLASSKDLASIAAMELSHALQHPDPAAPFSQIGTAQLQALRQLSDIFSAALPPRTPPPASPSSLNSSQFGTTVRQGPSDQMPIPPKQVQTPISSPSLAPRRSQRINPIQLPSPRVTPRLHSSDVAPTRVHPPLPPTTVIPITPNKTSVNAPYMPQGIAGVNLFNTFEEEHTPPTIPRHNTRARACQHAAHRAQTLRPRIFRTLAFPPRQTIPKHIANSVINEETGASLEYRHLINDASTFTVWNESAANEFGRLAQGVGNRIDGSNTIFFIPRQAVPTGKIVTYGRFVVDIRPNESEVHRVRLAVGGNLIQYQGDVSTRSADLTTSKCLWNSTISTDGAKYMRLDVKNFYLGTPMDTFEYMRIPIKLIPHEIMDQYSLLPLVSDGHVYIEVQKGMYGLPQAIILSNQLLARRLAIPGYHQTIFTPGLWRHVTRRIQFTLVVDDFGVQYVGAKHAHHLIAALETDYTVSKYWTGGLYCGITLNWDYANKYVDLSMPCFIKDDLHKFQHPLPKHPQYAPYNWTFPAYGQRVQYAPPPDTAPPATSADITRAQAIVGTLLYNA
jgi:hypothetical protein